MIISLQKNQTKIEEHTKTVHGEINYSNVVFALLISLQIILHKLHSNKIEKKRMETVHERNEVQSVEFT